MSNGDFGVGPAFKELNQILFDHEELHHDCHDNGNHCLSILRPAGPPSWCKGERGGCKEDCWSGSVPILARMMAGYAFNSQKVL